MKYYVDTHPTLWDKGNTLIKFDTEEARSAWLKENAPNNCMADGSKVGVFDEMSYDEWMQWRKEQGYE
jgi:hypothetical protein